MASGKRSKRRSRSSQRLIQRKSFRYKIQCYELTGCFEFCVGLVDVDDDSGNVRHARAAIESSSTHVWSKYSNGQARRVKVHQPESSGCRPKDKEHALVGRTVYLFQITHLAFLAGGSLPYRLTQVLHHHIAPRLFKLCRVGSRCSDKCFLSVLICVYKRVLFCDLLLAQEPKRWRNKFERHELASRNAVLICNNSVHR